MATVVVPAATQAEHQQGNGTARMLATDDATQLPESHEATTEGSAATSDECTISLDGDMMIAAATLAAVLAQVPWSKLKHFVKMRAMGRIPKKELFDVSTKPGLIHLARKYSISLEGLLYSSPISRDTASCVAAPKLATGEL